MSTEPQNPAVKQSLTAQILAANAHRTGQYADGYRLGAKDKAEGMKTSVEIMGAFVEVGTQYRQGYRDGLAGRPWRTPKRGKGAVARSSQRQAERRARLKATPK